MKTKTRQWKIRQVKTEIKMEKYKDKRITRG